MKETQWRAYMREIDGNLDPAWEEGYRQGAAVMAGIIALGTWAANGPPIIAREYWTSEIDGTRYYSCFCPGCGCQLKSRLAGVHEGTDMEWCGVCRDST